MKNRLYSILTTLVVLLFSNCGLPSGSVEDPSYDPRLPPQQEYIIENVEGRNKKDRIKDIAYSQDGTKLAVAGRNGIWLYDAQTEHELAKCLVSSGSVISIAFNPNGNTIVGTNTGYNSAIRIWDVDTGKNLRTYRYQVFEVEYSPDGKLIVGRDPKKNMYLLDADTGKLMHTFPEVSTFIWSVTFSPDGKTIANCSADNVIRLWDVNTGQQLRTLTLPTPIDKSLPNTILFSPDGKLIATNIDGSSIYLWNTSTGRFLRIIGKPIAASPKNLAFSPDGNMIARINVMDIELWDVNTGKLLRKLKRYGENNQVRRDRPGNIITGELGMFVLVFSPDGKLIASASPYEIHISDVNTGYLRKFKDY